MGSALRYVLESESAHRIVKFFRSRGDRARIIAPDWVRARIFQNLPQGHPPLRAIWSERPAAPDPGDAKLNFIVIAEDAEEEKSLLASLSQRPHAKAYGLFKDVLPALLCGSNGMARGRSTKALKRYAILCIPRSGSRYLTAMLIRKGIGVPQEHLRDPLATVIVEGKLGFPAAFASLERFAQRNGIFGTKLISSFLIKASRGNLAELETNLQGMASRGYLIVHLRRSLEDAVVSSYIAARLDKWHFFGELDASTRNRLEEMDFDERAAWDEYIRFRVQRCALDYLAGKLDLPVFEYGEIQADVARPVSSICGHLGLDPDSLEPGSASIPTATRTESPTYATFARALDELLSRRRHEIVPRTRRQLQSMLGVDQRMAEMMAGDEQVPDYQRSAS